MLTGAAFVREAIGQIPLLDKSGNKHLGGLPTIPRKTSPTVDGRMPGGPRTRLSELIKTASLSVKEAQSRYKIAEGDGTMSPDEAKEVSAEIVEMALSIADAASMIEEEVPAEENLNGDGMDTPVDQPEIPTNDTPVGEPEPPVVSTDDPEDLKQKLAQLQSEITTMKEAQVKTKLAQRYSQIFTEPQREAKYTEFMARSAPIGILAAQVMEAESLLNGQTPVIKQAQVEDNTFNLFDYESPQNESVHLGGRV